MLFGKSDLTSDKRFTKYVEYLRDKTGIGGWLSTSASSSYHEFSQDHELRSIHPRKESPPGICYGLCVDFIRRALTGRKHFFNSKYDDAKQRKRFVRKAQDLHNDTKDQQLSAVSEISSEQLERGFRALADRYRAKRYAAFVNLCEGDPARHRKHGDDSKGGLDELTISRQLSGIAGRIESLDGKFEFYKKLVQEVSEKSSSLPPHSGLIVCFQAPEGGGTSGHAIAIVKQDNELTYFDPNAGCRVWKVNDSGRAGEAAGACWVCGLSDRSIVRYDTIAISSGAAQAATAAS